MKYAILLTKGNDDTIIKCFDSKDEAKKFGDVYHAGMKHSDGVLSLVSYEADGVEKLYHIW